MINIDLADEFMDEQAPSVLAQQGWSLSAQSPSGSSSLRPNKPATIPEASSVVQSQFPHQNCFLRAQAKKLSTCRLPPSL